MTNEEQDGDMTNHGSLEQLLTPRYPAMSSPKLAILFIENAMKALGAKLPFADHLKRLEEIKAELDKSQFRNSQIDSRLH